MSQYSPQSFYRYVYELLCGRHPNIRIWHEQYSATFHIYKDLRRFLGSIKDKKITVCDVGCGSKPYKPWCGSVAEYVGIDIESGSHVDVVISQEGKWPLSNDYFDLVICTQVLEHVDNLEVTLGEIRRVLKSDGEAVIMVPFIYNAHGLPNDYRRYTMQGAIRLMSGFNVVKCHGQGGIGSTLAILLLNWIGVQKATSYIGRVIFTCLLPLWIPFCLLINTIARILDMLDTTSMFYNNVCLVVRKKADQNP